jgi:hypothetical protein
MLYHNTWVPLDLNSYVTGSNKLSMLDHNSYVTGSNKLSMLDHNSYVTGSNKLSMLDHNPWVILDPYQVTDIRSQLWSWTTAVE